VSGAVDFDFSGPTVIVTGAGRGMSGVGHLCAWEAPEVVVRELGSLVAGARPAAV
jgi:hypothetical protein